MATSHTITNQGPKGWDTPTENLEDKERGG